MHVMSKSWSTQNLSQMESYYYKSKFGSKTHYNCKIGGRLEVRKILTHQNQCKFSSSNIKNLEGRKLSEISHILHLLQISEQLPFL